MVVTYIAHKFYENVNSFFEDIVYKNYWQSGNENIVDAFYPSESLLLGNWKKGRSHVFKELCGTQDIADFYDLVNSLLSKTPTTVSEVKKISATKTIQSTLDPIVRGKPCGEQ